MTKQLLKILKRFKAEMVSYLNYTKTNAYKESVKELESKIDEIDELLKDHPMTKSMTKKFHEADMEDYIKKITYSDDEKKFMATNLNYLKSRSLRNKINVIEKKGQIQFIQRIMNDTMAEDEQTIFDTAEIHIWKTSKEYFGEESEFGNKYPMIKFGSLYYEILNMLWGYSIHDRFDKILSDMLEKVGFFYEPYNKSTWQLARS